MNHGTGEFISQSNSTVFAVQWDCKGGKICHEYDLISSFFTVSSKRFLLRMKEMNSSNNNTIRL